MPEVQQKLGNKELYYMCASISHLPSWGFFFVLFFDFKYYFLIYYLQMCIYV